MEQPCVVKIICPSSDEGRKYPTKQNSKLQVSISIWNFLVHVRPAEIMEDADKLINPDVYSSRRLWLNLPTGQGDLIGGYPSSEFHNDVFSMWNYTNLFGAWNHSMLQAPGSWADAAHKNGTHMFSGIEFFESWTGGGDSEYVALITQKNPDGTFRYVDAFLNALLFLGLDGINYNFEDSGYQREDVKAFHKALYKRAAEIGFDNFHIGMYTSTQYLTRANVDVLYGTTETGKTSDLMLNYNGGDFAGDFDYSVEEAEAAMGTADGLYGGVWIATWNRTWSLLNPNEEAKRCGVCLWGRAQSESLLPIYDW